MDDPGDGHDHGATDTAPDTAASPPALALASPVGVRGRVTLNGQPLEGAEVYAAVIGPSDPEVLERMHTPVSVSWDEVPLSQALEEVTREAGFALAVTPKAATLMEEEQVSVNLRLSRIDLANALRLTLSGARGLSFVFGSDTVSVGLTSELGVAQAGERTRSRRVVLARGPPAQPALERAGQPG